MVDIEPMLTYDCSTIGIKQIYGVILLIYFAFIYPIYAILNYDIKNNKEVTRTICKECIRVSKKYVFLHNS